MATYRERLIQMKAQRDVWITCWPGYCRKCNATGRLCLSGTALPNNQLDAFGQYRFLDQALFGSNFTKFKAKYCRMGGYGGYEIIEWLNQDEFKMRMDAITFRVDKSVLDLPSTMCVDRYCARG